MASVMPRGGAGRVRGTYRIQLRGGVTLDRLVEWLPALDRLGVSHVYLSPPFTASDGSTHGYDVCDPTRVDPCIGGNAAMERLFEALAERGMGCVVDVVPNHLSTSSAWWQDVLRRGRGSKYAEWFDVDWDPPDPRMHDRVLVPILAEAVPEAVAAGLLRVDTKSDEAVLWYRDTRLPLDPAGLDPDQLEGVNGDLVGFQTLLDLQHYRLAHWRTSASSRNYRRFFDIDTLVALRVERDDVFHATHRLVRAWAARGVVDGIRIDHIDGLRDPAGYAERLRALFPAGWIVAEKILAPEERLPSWPLDGTTGYDFLNEATRLFVDPAGALPTSAAYRSFTGDQEDFPHASRRARRLVCERLLDADVHRLVRLARDAGADGFDDDEVRDGLVEVAASLGCYRTYFAPGRERRPVDAKVAADALGGARAGRPELRAVIDRLAPLVDGSSREGRHMEVTERFQQLTPAIVAKGDEDTAFYRYARLLALNEVGGDPERFGSSVAAFHRTNRARQASSPQTMNATTTHDTKRSEDARVRIAMLSEIPGRWRRTVERWSELNRRHRRDGTPDRAFEWHLYQVLVGAHPLSVERLLAYAEKAMREAKTHTSWRNPDAEHEERVRGFIQAIMDDEAFVTELDGFVDRIVPAARVTSLALLLLKLTCPGVPDVYQGSETWNLTLVDPDNRRPVALGDLVSRLDRLPDATAIDVAADEAGLSKLMVTARGLQARREWPEAFGADGSYTAIAATGPQAQRVVAFQRGRDIAVVVPRLVLGLGAGWAGTTVALPAGGWQDLFTGAELSGGQRRVDDVLAGFPVALLVRTAR